MKHNTYSRRSHTVSTVKQVARDDPGGLAALERPPGGARPSWRGITPMAAQVVRIAVAETRTPRRSQAALDGLVAHR
jgi:hypothetical protein